MDIDIRGRIDNTPLKPYKVLTPLFEAISNSLHSIASSGRASGLVQVRMERSGKGLFGDATQPVGSISVMDDGVGFTDENFRAFCESDTPHKRSIGGKGMGRMFWLKAFDLAEIDSVFPTPDGQWKRRSFRFTYSREGIEEHHLVEASGPARTTVRLANVKEVYSAHLPKTHNTLALRLAEHFLPLLFDPKCPRIVVFDGTESTDVNHLFSYTFAGNSEVADFSVNRAHFTIRHILNPGPPDTPGHFVHLFAHDRGVIREPLTKFVPGAPKTARLLSGDQAFYYLGIVAGDVLDAAVDFDRNSFALPDSLDLADRDDVAVSMTEIHQEIGRVVRSYLEPYLRPVQEAKFDRVRRLAEREPQYRYLMKHHRDAIEQIPPDVTDEAALDVALRRIEFEARSRHRSQAEQLQRRRVSSIQDLQEYRDEYHAFIERENELGQLSLAQYVAHRRIVIDLLDKFFGLNDRGGYEFEELIHKIVCPMRITSDEAEFENHNLWLVDERMEFHAYLASDISLKSNEVTSSEDLARPDLLVFSRKMAFSDERPFSSIVVVEFKRPGRDDYDSSNNPVDQIEDYVYRLRQGKLKDERGRFIDPPHNIQFFGYVVCDVTPSLRALAERRGWPASIDGQGFFHYNPKQNAYIEVIGYDKMLADARKRNRILFEKLNLSTT